MIYPQLTRLGELFVQSYERYLPSAFDESMSILEKLNKIIEYVNQTGLLVNGAVDLIESAITKQDLDITALQEEYILFKEEFDGNLESKTISVLDDWFVSGKLADIINNDVFNMKANQVDLEKLSNEFKNIDWMSNEFNGVKFIAHRGFSQYYPENTLKAYIEADRAGFFGWELDPFVTSDGVWINMHDTTVDRTTNGTGSVSSLTYDYIKSLKIDGGANATLFKGMSVPSLEECFELASRMKVKPIMFLNNRSDTPIDAERTLKLAEIIRKYNYEKKSVIFTHITSFYGIRKEIQDIGVCYDFGTAVPTVEQLDELQTFSPNAMAGISYSVLLGTDGASLVEMCKSRGLLIQAHTVNVDSDVVKLTDLGVNSILTDSVISL